MKYLLIVLVLFSCSKQQVDNPETSSEISFDVPAGHFVNPVSGIKVKGNVISPGYYSFSGIKGAGELAQVTITTDSLKVQTYHQTFGSGSGSSFSLNNTIYGYIELTDYLDITITSYSNGVVNGSFSGRVTKAVSLNPYIVIPTMITGVIKNATVRHF